jgi:hypothetical protein
MYGTVPGIKLAGDDLLDLVEHLDGHVAGAGTNLQDHVCVSQGRLKLFYKTFQRGTFK